MGSYSMKNIINKIFNKFKKFSLTDVFTPTVSARCTYIARTSLEKEFMKNYELPGKQIILFGDSGSGKTTLIYNLVSAKDYIKSICTHDDTFQSLITDAFSQLNIFYTESISSQANTSLKLDSSPFSAQTCNSNTSNSKVLLSPQLVIQNLAKEFGKRQYKWVIEDVHKLPTSERRRLASALKVFVDISNQYPKTKIICLGAVDSPRNILSLDDNLKGRVAEIKVPLLTKEETKSIITQGCKLLNISMSEDLSCSIINASNKLASQVHQMCYDICCAKELYRTQSNTVYLGEECYKIAIDAYLMEHSDSLCVEYETQVSDLVEKQLLQIIILANQEKVSLEYLRRMFKSINENIDDDALFAAINKLSTSDTPIIRYDSVTSRCSISTPIWGAFIKIRMENEPAEYDIYSREQGDVLRVFKNDLESVLYRSLLDIINKMKD